MSKTFKLPYWVSNGGDGSASVRFETSEKEAEQKDDEQNEEGEGWGESSASTVEIKVEDDKLYIKSFEKVGGKYEYIWKQVKQ